MTIQQVHEEIAEHCDAISKLFKSGAKVSVVVRNPGYGNVKGSADVFVGDDEPDEVIEAILRLKERPLMSLKGGGA